jgi:hypothetical protein
MSARPVSNGMPVVRRHIAAPVGAWGVLRQGLWLICAALAAWALILSLMLPSEPQPLQVKGEQPAHIVKYFPVPHSVPPPPAGGG